DRLGLVEQPPTLALHPQPNLRGATHDLAYRLSRLPCDRANHYHRARAAARPRVVARGEPSGLAGIIFRNVLDLLEGRGPDHRTEADAPSPAAVALLPRVPLAFGRWRGLGLVGGASPRRQLLRYGCCPAAAMALHRLRDRYRRSIFAHVWPRGRAPRAL